MALRRQGLGEGRVPAERLGVTVRRGPEAPTSSQHTGQLMLEKASGGVDIRPQRRWSYLVLEDPLPIS